jgi:hypothetical protein
MQARGEGPPNDHVQAMLEIEWQRAVAGLERDAARPASRRLPRDAAPPREVLQAAASIELMDEQPPGPRGLVNVTRYIDEASGKMSIGFNIKTTQPFGTQELGSARVARLPWRNEFGAWPPLHWAWLLALALRKVGPRCEVLNVVPTYKLQTAPRDDFREALQEAFVDVCRTARMQPHAERFAGASLASGPVDIDKQNTWRSSLTRSCGAWPPTWASRLRTAPTRPP